jgi:hypothetical protein
VVHGVLLASVAERRASRQRAGKGHSIGAQSSAVAAQMPAPLAQPQRSVALSGTAPQPSAVPFTRSPPPSGPGTGMGPCT